MLRNDMTKQGAWLFHWRAYLPLILVPVAFSLFKDANWMTNLIGEPAEEVYDYFCLFIALAGLAIRVATVGFVPAGTSGRNTHFQNASELNTTGCYSIMRHPLYFANFLVFIAFVLLMKNLLFTLFAAVIYFLYYERIMLAEEQFLESRYGAAFRDWAAKTPAFFPRLSHWTSPALPFSWRAAVGREFHSILLVAAVFFLVEMLEAGIAESQTLQQWLSQEPFWSYPLIAGTTIYLTVRLVKKQTHWLSAPGR